MKNRYDTIIVGTGAAGLYASLNLDEEKQILLITKDEAMNCDSYLAQGGISCLHDDGDYAQYFADTLKAGRYENCKIAVHDMIMQSRTVINDLIAKGVDFDLHDGEIEYTREGGHSIFRILHHADVTGKEITSKLYDRVRERKNITIMEYTEMLDILEVNGVCCGVVLRLQNGDIVPVEASDVILATGGIGGLFQNSTNFAHTTGDSFAIALRHNVELKNIHYIQIHPTVLYSKKEGRRFLISESVRGEGAILRNEKGERFIDELLPRDVVAGAILQEMNKFGTDHVYLDFCNIPKDKILRHFPNIYAKCLDEGYDVTKECIPVVPAQHYLMGGIRADICGITSMPHLFAVGEVACNGVHGANRLASNSLLESLTFSKNAARVINYNSPANTVRADLSEFDADKYRDTEAWNKENKRLVLDEIKKNDEVFYDKWCNYDSECR